jgi:diguanylate cyclase (GGDEF)-like protein/PAS domain S-box-containing protein
MGNRENARAGAPPPEHSSGAGRRWPASLGVYPLVLALMLGALLGMEGRAADARETEGMLSSAEAGLYRLDAESLEEWSDVQVIDDGSMRDEIAGELSTVAADFDRLMAGSAADEIAPINTAFRAYADQLTYALGLAAAGRIKDSVSSFKQGADLSLTDLVPILADAALTFRQRAERADRAKNVGTIATLIVGLSILALLGIRSSRQSGRLLTSRAHARVLKRSETRFRSLMAGSADLVTVLDRGGVVQFQGSSIEQMLGWTVQDVQGRDLRKFLHPDDARALGHVLERVEQSEGSRESVDWRMLKADGEMLHTEAIITAKFDDPEIGGFLVSVRDLSERLVLEDALRHQAFHDPLTKLPNRSLFEDRVAHAFERTARSGRSLCLLLADLDDFKDINDSFGHAFGDRVLKAVSVRLRSVLRDEDTVARLGGDEFAILIDEAEDDDGLLLAERIMAALEESISIGDTEVYVHTSLGIVTGSASTDARPQDERLEGQLLIDADLAMYEAKRQGRGQFRFYAPAMQEGVHERQTMRSDLERGLSRDEFFVYYQPIFSIETEAIVGAEALARWQHPDRGLVMPLDFIPVAEQTGLILELGRRVLRMACREAATWHGRGGSPDPYVSVNVTGSQLQQPSFIQDVRDALADAGLPPDRLVVEMTESSLIEDADDSVLRLKQLHDLGVRLAIDDFGTGYSSLSYLRRFNMDILKIDKVFVDELGHDEKRSALVAAMVGMGSSLGMQVVAEGIEERAQLDDLRDLHCDLGQGYLIARPLPPEDLLAMMREPRLTTAVVPSSV